MEGIVRKLGGSVMTEIAVNGLPISSVFTAIFQELQDLKNAAQTRPSINIEFEITLSKLKDENNMLSERVRMLEVQTKSEDIIQIEKQLKQNKEVSFVVVWDGLLQKNGKYQK